VIETGKTVRLISLTALISILMLMLAFSVLAETATAQTTSNYYVTVNPATPTSTMYTTVGRNWTISFEASWSYGDDSGQAIKNATVTIQVNNSKKDIINTLHLNSTAGLFSFNYSSSTADILTFTPIKLITQDGKEWEPNLLDAGNSLYGFQSKSVEVWWDTFHVSLASYNTSTLGVTAVSANVTYLLLPEEGLSLPAWATYSNQTFLPKTAQNASVTINGVDAEETSAGVYTADVSTWLPTAYIQVQVTQEKWATTHNGFSFAHNANAPLWEYAAIIGAVLIGIALTVFVLSGKSKRDILSTKKKYAVLGGALLAVISVISLYWGVVGLDSSLHGFDWMPLTIMGLLSFGFGLVASVLSLRRKNQALVIFAVIAPMLTNLVFVKTSLDMYQLANPWLILISSIFLSFISGILICNADEAFMKK